MAAGTPYAKRFAGGFVDLPSLTTDIDQTFLNAVEAALLQLIGAAPTVDGQVAQWDNVNTRYGPALLLNKNIAAGAAIAKSKLDFTGGNGIVDADVAGAAAIALSKISNPADATKFARGDGTWATPATQSVVPVATTIAGLGTTLDGKVGRLKVAIPTVGGNDYITMVYDGVTLNKWISEATPIWSSSNPAAGNFGTNSGGGGLQGSGGVQWKSLLAAGLTPQFKFDGMTFDTSTSTNMFGYINQYHISEYFYAAAVPNDLTLIAQLSADQRAQTTGSEWVGWHTSWLTGSIPGSPKEILIVSPSTSRATTQIAGTVWMRWIG